MVLKIQVFGLAEANRFIDKKVKQAVRLAGDGAEKAALHLQNEVKLSITGRRPEPTSVDTGRFLNSVEVKKAGLNSEIFTKIPYSKFLEYGTSSFPARHHFKNTAFREKHKVKEMLQTEVNKV